MGCLEIYNQECRFYADISGMGTAVRVKKRGSTTLIETALISATVGIVLFTSSKALAPSLSYDYNLRSCTYKNNDLLATSDEEWDVQSECFSDD